MSSERRKGRHYEDYIGDGAYVYISDFNEVVLYTSDGITETNTVVMEPSVLSSFERWLARARQAMTEESVE